MNRNNARTNKQLSINTLINKPVARWSNDDKTFYSKHRVRYQNAVNKKVKGNQGSLRGLARLREAGRGFGMRARNRLGAAGLGIRGGLSMGRYAGNLTAAAGARGYSGFARGLGAAAKYGYRGAHAMGNAPRKYGAIGRARNSAAVEAAINKSTNVLNELSNRNKKNAEQFKEASRAAVNMTGQVAAAARRVNALHRAAAATPSLMNS
jgi:hypothetical protein